MLLVNRRRVTMRPEPASRDDRLRTEDAREGEQGRWYAVQCQPNRERAAALHLANQTFEIFLPLRNKTRRHARKIETVRIPFFPGYLFVELDLARHRWRSVNGTFGVARLVMQGELPAPAPRGFVEALQSACAAIDVVEWRADLTVGEAVRVLTGPFAGLVGELDRMIDSDRVRVLLQIMGGHFPVSVPRFDVVPADSVL
jgi:transcription elongation factor/antiterminator RfaH